VERSSGQRLFSFSLAAAERSDVEWRESQQVSDAGARSPGKCLGDSCRAVKVLADGHLCPAVLEARVVCAVSTGGSISCEVANSEGA
jgi:hypothetical protein